MQYYIIIQNFDFSKGQEISENIYCKKPKQIELDAYDKITIRNYENNNWILKKRR